jgi:oligoribonuclease
MPNEPANLKRFVWIDVETTGLDPAKDLILEVGIIITDYNMTEVARSSWVVRQDLDRVHNLMSPYVRDMHKASGLLQELWSCEELPNALTTIRVCHWLESHLGTPSADPAQRPVLAGSSVHFDRAMLAAQMPRVLDFLHYRNLDVSTLKELCFATVPGARRTYETICGHTYHRALADLEGSIAELQYWRKVLSEVVL